MCLDGAGCGLTSRLAAARMAEGGLARPCACGHWLPVWLPPGDLVSNGNVRIVQAQRQLLDRESHSRASPAQRATYVLVIDPRSTEPRRLLLDPSMVASVPGSGLPSAAVIEGEHLP